jgi:hypothetical protein
MNKCFLFFFSRSHVDPSHVTYQLQRSRPQREVTARSIIDVHADNDQHWLIHPNPRTPSHIIDSRLRLGQLKNPAMIARARSAFCKSIESPGKIAHPQKHIESKDTVHEESKGRTTDERHFLDFHLPETPNDLRAARYRIDSHRYHSSLDNYPPQPQTSPREMHEVFKALQTNVDTNTDSKPTIASTSLNHASFKDNENTKTSDNECTSTTVHPLDIVGLPSEYTQVLTTGHATQEEYLNDGHNRSDEQDGNTYVYRLPVLSNDEKTSSIVSLIDSIDYMSCD